MKMNIKATIEYRSNDELWAMERIAKENGYKKTEDCCRMETKSYKGKV